MRSITKKFVHILLVSPPSSAKTMFLLDIRWLHKQSLFVIGSSTTKAGLQNRLFEVREELEKMNRKDQNSLPHLMETGIILKPK